MKEILRTRRLLLREMTEGDIPDLEEMLLDPEVMYAYPHTFTKEDVENRLARQQPPAARRSLARRAAKLLSVRYMLGALLLGFMGWLSPWRGWYWAAALFCAVMAAATAIASFKERRQDPA